MRTHLLAPLLLTPLLAASPLQAGEEDADWSAEFDLPGLSGRVFALGEYGGELIAGGHVFPTDGAWLSHVARFDGSSWQPLGAGVGDDVRAIVEFQGDLIVAGSFVSAGGQPASGIARWDGAQWHPLGQGLQLSFAFQPEVWTLAVYQGSLYAGGSFDRAGGQVVRSLARWDGLQWSSVGGGVAGEVVSLHAEPTTLYVGGTFAAVGAGVPASCVAAWNGTSWSSLGAGFGSTVRSLAWFQGRLFAGGTFLSSGGQPVKKIAFFSGGTWHPLGAGVPDTSILTSVYALEVHGGSLYLGGNFSSVDGVPTLKVARWDGAQIHGFGGIAGSSQITTAFALKGLGGDLHVGGEFKRAGTDPFGGDGVATENIAAWDGVAWSAVGQGLGMNGTVLGFGHWNGGIVAVGSYSTAGTTLVNNVAWFDGGVWKKIGQLGGTIRDLIEYQGDLVIVGDFTSIDGVPANRIARYDGQQWKTFGAGFTASNSPSVVAEYQGQLYVGGVGPVQRWNGAAWEQFGNPIFGQILALRSYLGKLYIGGSFGAFSGPGPHLAVWDGVTTTSLGADGLVNTFEEYEGALLAGGTFSNAAGVSASRIARFDGAQWSAFVAPVDGVEVRDLEVVDDVLFVAGNPVFYENGQPRYLGRWDGATLESLGSGLLGAPLALLADDAAGKLWIGGSFFKAGGRPAGNITTWDVRNAWTNVGLGLAGTHGTPTMIGTGTLASLTPVFLFLDDMLENSFVAFIVGASRVDLPFLGGTLVPSPDVLLAGLPTGPVGALTVGASFPPGLPPGASFHLQAWVVDPAAPQGYAATNALTATTP